MRLNPRRTHHRDDSGLTTIFVVFFATLLLATVAVGVDVSRAVAVTRSAQNSADAVTLAMAKDCVIRGGMGSTSYYDSYIRTTPAIGNGQSESLTAGSCPDGFVKATARETVGYTFAKVIGMTSTTKSRSATARWSRLAGGIIFPFTFSTCAFPDSFLSGNATTPGTPLMLYGQVTRTSCALDSDTTGQSANSKGFVTDGCVMKTLGGTLHDANGNSFTGTACDSANIDYYVGKDVLLPVWGSAASSGSGGNAGSDYTITHLVGFHVLGWSGNGSAFGGAMTTRCTVGTFQGDATTLGDTNKPCLYGYVTSFTSTTGGTTGESCTTGGPLDSSCYVYLDS